jgi:uncharacterized repeat protein (TIGR01451 family)
MTTLWVVICSVLGALAVALGLPLQSARASVSPVEDLIAQCPSSAEVASFNIDLAITFEGTDPSGGTLVCHASDGSVDLTRFQERAYQALRVMKVIRFTRSLPWTSQNLYDWFVASVDGIRFRSDIDVSFCCDPANVIDIRAASNSAALFTDRWIDPTSPIGLHDLLALLVHEARHNNGKPHTCGADDQTVAELGAWGVEYYLELWEGLYSGAFLTSPEVYPSYYRDEHLLTAESLYLPRICSLPNSDLSLAIGSPAPSPAVRGQNVAYTFTAANSGPDAASDVFVYSPVPSGTTFIGATTSQGSCSAEADGPIACAFGRIASGASATATVTLLVDPLSTVTSITNKESPAALGARVTGPDRDSNLANNSASFLTPVVQRTADDVLTDLIGRVRSLALADGLKNSLVAKLQVARRNVESGLTQPACNELHAFLNEVRALVSADALPDAQTAPLMEAAGLAEAAVPCV